MTAGIPFIEGGQMGAHEHGPLSGYRRAPDGLPALVVAFCAFTAVGGFLSDAPAWQVGTAVATAVGAWLWPREPARVGCAGSRQ